MAERCPNLKSQTMHACRLTLRRIAIVFVVPIVWDRLIAGMKLLYIRLARWYKVLGAATSSVFRFRGGLSIAAFRSASRHEKRDTDEADAGVGIDRYRFGRTSAG